MWTRWVLEGKGKERGQNPFFFSGGPEDAGQHGRKRELEGSREVGCERLITQCMEGKEREPGMVQKPCWSVEEKMGVLVSVSGTP